MTVHAQQSCKRFKLSDGVAAVSRQILICIKKLITEQNSLKTFILTTVRSITDRRALSRIETFEYCWTRDNRLKKG